MSLRISQSFDQAWAERRRIVLDVLKPHNSPLLEFTRRLAKMDGVAGATGSLIELDQEVQNIMFTAEGEALEYPSLEDTIEGLGGTIHSVD